MDIKNLQKFIKLSQEDFADAHEPVNDGVKDTPNAADIAAMVGRKGGEDGAADITKQGEPKVIPEEKEEETSKSEMTTVVESNAETPRDKAPAAPAAKETTESETETETETETPVKDEPELAHDDVKTVETDEKVTAKEKESLEAFVPFIKRSELIGYSKRDTEALTKSIGRVRAKAGVRGAFTVSAESIQETITLAETHLGKLSRKKKFLKQRDLRISKENFVPGSVEVEEVLNQQPLVHPGAAPLPQAVAEGITLQELSPVIDTVIEDQVITDTYQQIEVLQESAVAVEAFTQLLRENKGRVSKQAAAIIHTALEHIDLTCSLRARATGLENFDTSPRAALEDAEVNEKTLSNRAAEIGAKILKFLKMLWDKAEDLYTKFTAGISKLQNDTEAFITKCKGNIVQSDSTQFTLEKTDAKMFIGTEFVGTKISKEEQGTVTDLLQTAKRVLGVGVGPLVAAVKSGGLDDETYSNVERIFKALEQGDKTHDLPGGHKYVRNGITTKIELDDSRDYPDSVDIRLMSVNELRKSGEDLKKYLDVLGSSDAMDVLRKANRDLTKGVGEFRSAVKGGENFDEQGFQGFQQEVIDKLIKPFDLPNYVSMITTLARMVGPRLFVLNTILAQHKAKDDSVRAERDPKNF